MKIYERIERNTAVLTIEGKLMGDPETPKIHERVKHLLTTGIRGVVVDLKPLVWLNSAGLGILIASMITVRKSGGDVILANVAGKAKELINMTHLDQVFKEYESVEKALDSFESELKK